MLQFTQLELAEFKRIWRDSFDEELNDVEAGEMAVELVETLYALTNGEAFEVRYNNTALVTIPNNLQNND